MIKCLKLNTRQHKSQPCQKKHTHNLHKTLPFLEMLSQQTPKARKKNHSRKASTKKTKGSGKRFWERFRGERFCCKRVWEGLWERILPRDSGKALGAEDGKALGVGSGGKDSGGKDFVAKEFAAKDSGKALGGEDGDALGVGSGGKDSGGKALGGEGGKALGVGSGGKDSGGKDSGKALGGGDGEALGVGSGGKDSGKDFSEGNGKALGGEDGDALGVGDGAQGGEDLRQNPQHSFQGLLFSGNAAAKPRHAPAASQHSDGDKKPGNLVQKITKPQKGSEKSSEKNSQKSSQKDSEKDSEKRFGEKFSENAVG